MTTWLDGKVEQIAMEDYIDHTERTNALRKFASEIVERVVPKPNYKEYPRISNGILEAIREEARQAGIEVEGE